MKTLLCGSEYMKVDDRGQITRPAIGMHEPSGQWRMEGAVRYNNFGYVVQRYTLDQVLNSRLAWKHKNGKQRIHICDIDHGTPRVWLHPNHEIM